MKFSQISNRNPITKKAHARQRLWQITLPLVVGVIVVIALLVLASLAGTAQASRWADISLIFLLIPVMVISLIFLVLGAGLVYALVRVLQVIPAFAFRVQNLFTLIEDRVRTGANLAAEPIIRVSSWLAAIRTLRREL
jgi:hypothetical protein